MRIHHLALRCENLRECREFYRDVLGLPEVRELAPAGGEAAARAVWLQAGETVIMLERRLRGVGPETGSAHVLSFEVQDLTSWEKKLEAAGVAIDDRTEATLFFRDPAGHRVGLSRYRFEVPEA